MENDANGALGLQYVADETAVAVGVLTIHACRYLLDLS